MLLLTRALLLLGFKAAVASAGAAAAAEETPLHWKDARSFLKGTGFAPDTKSAFYDRLPAEAVNTTRSPVWSLSRDTAGMYLSFASNTTELTVNVTYVYGSFAMWHFPSTGVAGMDLYAWDENSSAWRWTSTTHTQGPGLTASNTMHIPRNCSGPVCHLTRFRLHLPLYNGIAKLSLGYKHHLGADTDPRTVATEAKLPVVWYGTSIAQGGVASRPGMAFTNSIASNIDRPVLNFGFSGNGLMEIGVAQWLVKIKAAAYVIDCNWNMQPSQIASAVVPLVKYIRQTRPDTPIILAEGTEAGSSWISQTTHKTQSDKRAALKAGFDELVAGGDKNVHYVNGTDLFRFDSKIAVDPDGIISPTVGGCHPSDLGMKAVSDFYSKYLPTVLDNSDSSSDEPFTSLPPSAAAAAATATGGGVPDGRGATKFEQLAHCDAVERSMMGSSSEVAHAQTDTAIDLAALDYTDVESSDLVVMGRAFDDTDARGYFNRLPGSAQGVVRETVWGLSQMSTGMFVPFVTNSTTVAWNFSLIGEPSPMWHMPASGMHGADLFCRSHTAGPGSDSGSSSSSSPYRFVGAANNYPVPPASVAVVLGSGLTVPASALAPAPTPAGQPLQPLQPTQPAPPGQLHCGIYLPLRNTIAFARIGVDAGASMAPDPDFGADGITWRGRKPIVWYGTSIDQGGVASRPGSTYTNVLSRLLERMVLNFGFAGNGVMEESVAQYLTKLDAAMFVIDCLPNMQPFDVSNRTVPLVKYLRTAHPDTPIMLTAGTTYGSHWYEPAKNDDKRAVLKAQYDALVDGGDKNVHLMLDEMDQLFAGQPLVNPTVGGTHPSDLGHREIATFWASYLPQFLK